MHWQFSLRMMLGLFVLLGIEFWLVKQGFAWCIFGPLFLALALQLAGFPRAAHHAGLATIVWWLFFPCILGLVYG